MSARRPDPTPSPTTASDEAEGGHASRWTDPERVIVFSDAVFAIVITLLVLDLTPPAVAPGQLLAGLLAQWPTYLAYLASYLVVGVVWMNHRAVFPHIRRMDPGLAWSNLTVLFTIGLLPFPTAVVTKALGAGNRADEQTAVGVYALITVAISLSWVGFFHYLRRHPALLQHHADVVFFARERVRAGIGAVLYAAAGVFGYLISPGLALTMFVLLPPFFALTSEGLPRGRGNQRRS